MKLFALIMLLITCIMFSCSFEEKNILNNKDKTGERTIVKKQNYLYDTISNYIDIMFYPDNIKDFSYTSFTIIEKTK